MDCRAPSWYLWALSRALDEEAVGRAARRTSFRDNKKMVEAIAAEERLFMERSRRDIEGLREQLRHLAALRCVNQKHSFKQESGRAQIFPGQCKNAFSLRRFIRDETQRVLDRSTPTYRRHQLAERLLTESAPPRVERGKSMSAMYRDLKSRASTRLDAAYRVDTPGPQREDALTRLRTHLSARPDLRVKKMTLHQPLTLPQVKQS